MGWLVFSYFCIGCVFIIFGLLSGPVKMERPSFARFVGWIILAVLTWPIWALYGLYLTLFEED